MIRHHLSVNHRRHWGPRSRLSTLPILEKKTGGKELRKKRTVRRLQNNGTATADLRLGQMHVPATKCASMPAGQAWPQANTRALEYRTLYGPHEETCWLPNKRVWHLCRIDHKGITKLLSTPTNSYTLNESWRRDRSKGWNWETWLLLTIWQSLSMGRHAVWQLGTNVSEKPVAFYFTVLVSP